MPIVNGAQGQKAEKVFGIFQGPTAREFFALGIFQAPGPLPRDENKSLKVGGEGRFLLATDSGNTGKDVLDLGLG